MENLFVMTEKEPDNKEESPGDLKSFERKQAEFFITQRKLFMWGGVDDESMEKLIRQMLFLANESDDDITLFINSPGGVISSGLALYDLIQTIKADVSTVVMGQAASMGAVLSTAGTKGKRFAWPHARIMIHQPLIQGQFQGVASDIEIQAEEMRRVRTELNKLLAFHTGHDADKIEIDTDRDNFMTGAEAVKYGLIDEVKTVY